MGRHRPRMDFEQLLSLQDLLDAQLIREEMTWSQYESAWQDLLKAAGYTLGDYELGIDRRWDYIDRLRNHITVRGLA